MVSKELVLIGILNMIDLFTSVWRIQNFIFIVIFILPQFIYPVELRLNYEKYFRHKTFFPDFNSLWANMSKCKLFKTAANFFSNDPVSKTGY